MNKKTIGYYLLIAAISLLPLCLIFNENIWFDESYTLALIRHSFGEIIRILQSDMHPPLYFLSLKAFCTVFGYSIAATKVFSLLGYTVLILSGSELIRRLYDRATALLFALALPAIPMIFYFSVQQRAYSWCVCFVTLCFLFGMAAARRGHIGYYIAMAVTGLLAAYNHFFALMAVAITVLLLNLYILIKKRREWKQILLSDAVMILGYLPWLIPLIRQAKDAVSDFWLKGLEQLSVIVFLCSVALVAVLLLINRQRRLEELLAAACVLGFQTIGILGTILVRPFYIARYSIVIAGIGACFIAFSLRPFKKGGKTIAALVLCLALAFNLVRIAVFEYDREISDFRERFSSVVSEDDTFLYVDSSFGVMQYYFPTYTHICTYRKDWFDAFEGLAYIDRNEVTPERFSSGRLWLVKMYGASIPAQFEERFSVTYSDGFLCDLNTYEVYELTAK